MPVFLPAIHGTPYSIPSFESFAILRGRIPCFACGIFALEPPLILRQDFRSTRAPRIVIYTPAPRSHQESSRRDCLLIRGRRRLCDGYGRPRVFEGRESPEPEGSNGHQKDDEYEPPFVNEVGAQTLDFQADILYSLHVLILWGIWGIF